MVKPNYISPHINWEHITYTLSNFYFLQEAMCDIVVGYKKNMVEEFNLHPYYFTYLKWLFDFLQ